MTKAAKIKEAGTRVLKVGSMTVIVGCSNVNGAMYWHVTIAHPTRMPKFDEIDGVLDKVLPVDTKMKINMRDGVKFSQHTVHLWEEK